MLGWLGGLIGLFTGGLSAIWNAFVNVIRTVEGQSEQRDMGLQSEYNNLYAGLFRLSAYTTAFVNRTFSPWAKWVDGAIFNLSAYMNSNFAQVRNDIANTRSWASGQISAARSFAESLFTGFIKWIISTIFGPLSKDVAQALNWIFHEGAMILDLITHPEKLLKLLWVFIFGSWVTFLVKFGPIIAAWLLRMWKPILPVVVNVLEDILTHIL